MRAEAPVIDGYGTFPGSHELKVGRFIADIVGEHGIMEIQTRQFGKMCGKLAAFLSVMDVTVVYPVIALRHIYWLDPAGGGVIKRRKSPRVGSILDISPELYPIRGLLLHPRLSFLIIRVDVEDYRILDGRAPDRKKERPAWTGFRLPCGMKRS